MIISPKIDLLGNQFGPSEMVTFEDLPAELQLMIFEIIPENLRVAQQINHPIRQVTQRSWFQRCRQRPISRREYQTHLATRPGVIGLSVRSLETLTIKIYFGLNKDLYFKASSVVTTAGFHDDVVLQFTLDQGDDRAKYVFATTRDLDYSPHFDLDLATQYQIFSRRRSCVNYARSQGSNYARDNVLQILEGIYRQRSGERVRDVMMTFLELANNAVIVRTPTLPEDDYYHFGIDGDGMLETRNNRDEARFNQILEFIDVLYQEIRDYFLTLS
jgi:hypothetical protein